MRLARRASVPSFCCAVTMLCETPVLATSSRATCRSRTGIVRSLAAGSALSFRFLPLYRLIILFQASLAPVPTFRPVRGPQVSNCGPITTQCRTSSERSPRGSILSILCSSISSMSFRCISLVRFGDMVYEATGVQWRACGVKADSEMRETLAW